MKQNRNNFFLTIEKSLKNARELFIDAQILKENKRFERAYTCFQFCIEEIGKASLTFQYLINDDHSKYAKYLKDFRDHKTKTKTAIRIDLIMFKLTDKPELKRKILLNSEIQGEKIDYFNEMKNYSLYTSLIDGKANLPSEIITSDDLEEIEFYANTRLVISTKFFKSGIEEFDEILKATKELDTQKLNEQIENECRELLSTK